MDSFYDAPRRPPPQISREKLSGVPVVPEISLLVPPTMSQTKFTPYSQWKQQQTNQNGFFAQNKENLTSNFPNSVQNNSILKKVRFENNQLAQTQESNKNAYCILKEHNSNQHIPAKVEVPFEQMYMANIPSRQLDLSLIDMPKKPESPCLEPQAQHIESKCKEFPKTYRDFLQSQEKIKEEHKTTVLDDTVTDIFNYKRHVPNNTFSNRGPTNTGTRMDVFHGKGQSDELIMKNAPNKVKYFDVMPDFMAERNQVNELSENENVDLLSHKKFSEPAPAIHKEVSFLASQKNGIYSNDLFSQKGLYLDTKNSANIVPKTQNYNTQNSPNFQQKMKCDFPPEVQLKAHNSQDECHSCKKTEKMSEKNDNNLNTSDLLKIISQQSQQIAQQNNQLMLLQQQVSELVSIHKNYEKERQHFILRGPPNEDAIKCIERQPCCQHVYHEKVADHEKVQEKYLTSTQHNVGEPNFFDLAKKTRNHRPNFSIGLTTSLEVSFRRPLTETESKSNKVVNYEYQPAKIEEITESDVASENRYTNNNEKNSFRETLIDTSLLFKEPIKVRETCPSPEPSININMNDFEDTDSEDESSQIGATFYRNLMAQVNKVLQKAQIDSMEKVAYDSPDNCLDNQTMHRVKEATLKHLKRIGVNLPNDGNIYTESCSSEESTGVSYTKDDVSFAVKQLLMKYLPSDHLARLASKKQHNKDELDLTPKQNIGAIKSRPDFSFASVQYMKKYNLIANSQKEFPSARRQANSQSPKILDITKLKQQPKLL